MLKKQFFSPWKGVKLGSSENFLKTTGVGRFRNHFLCKYFELEIWRTCYQHRDYPLPKIPWQNFFLSILGRVSMWAAVNFFSQSHILVDFEYLFLYESFGLEICHTCYEHRNDVMPKNSW